MLSALEEKAYLAVDPSEVMRTVFEVEVVDLAFDGEVDLVFAVELIKLEFDCAVKFVRELGRLSPHWAKEAIIDIEQPQPRLFHRRRRTRRRWRTNLITRRSSSASHDDTAKLSSSDDQKVDDPKLLLSPGRVPIFKVLEDDDGVLPTLSLSPPTGIVSSNENNDPAIRWTHLRTRAFPTCTFLLPLSENVMSWEAASPVSHRQTLIICHLTAFSS
jgi:hypothetical protein